MSKAQEIKKKVVQKSAIHVKKGAKQRTISESSKKKFLPIKLEYPDSILEQVHEIGLRFRKRYDELVDNGHFKDLQEEFQQVMDSEDGMGLVAVDLRISLYDYLSHGEPIPIRRSIVRFSNTEEGSTFRDRIFVCSYLVDQQIVTANNETCPACGHEWKRKLPNEVCPHCESVIGEDILFIIEDDRCPHCNHKGIVENGMTCKGCNKKLYEGTFVISQSE